MQGTGYNPVTYDNLSRGHRWAVKLGPLEEGDIADVARLRDVIGRHVPGAVMHFAGFGYVGESMVSPDLYYSNNVSSTQRLLEAMHQSGLRNIIFSSSCATYGGVHDKPIAEDAPQAPVSTYWFQQARGRADACGLRGRV